MLGRRTALGLVALGALAWFAAMGPACAAGSQVTISLWHGHTGPDGQIMDQLAREFQQEHPDIRIEITVVPWAELFTKTLLAVQGGTGPDIVSMPVDRFIIYKDTVFKPIDDLVAGRFDPADFDPYLWEAAVIDGKRYGIPLDTHPYVLYYRPDLIEEAGLQPLPKDRPLTRDEFMHYAETLSGRGRYGFGFKGIAHWAWWDTWPFFIQNGGRLYNEDQTRLMLDTPEALEVVRFLRSLQTEYRVVPTQPMDWQGLFSRFQTGNIAMVMHGSWLIPALREADVPWETALLPALFDEVYATFANSHQFGFTRLNPQRTEAALVFAEWMSEPDHAYAWGYHSGNVPANLEAARRCEEDPRLRPIVRSAELMKEADSLFMSPYHPEGDTILHKWIAPNLEQVYAGLADPERALRTITQGAASVFQP